MRKVHKPHEMWAPLFICHPPHILVTPRALPYNAYAYLVYCILAVYISHISSYQMLFKRHPGKFERATKIYYNFMIISLWYCVIRDVITSVATMIQVVF